MKMTLDMAVNLLSNGTKIREITVNELKHSETDIMTVRPFDVYEEIMSTLLRYENSIGRIGVPTLYASHLSVTSVNGKQVMVGRSGKPNTRELLDESREEEQELTEEGTLNYEDQVDVSIRYGRILFQIPIGDERKYQMVLSCLYSLEKKRLEVTFGARYMDTNAINIPSDRYLMKGDEANLYSDVIPKLVDILDNYSSHAMHIVNSIEKLQDRWLSLEDIKAIIARMHYVQACIKHKDYSGLEEVIDDRVAKDMHYLIFHSHYDYRIKTEQGGGSAWQCYQAINEALRDTDLSLLEFHGKYLQAFNFYALKLDNFLKATHVKEFENGTNVYTEVPITADAPMVGERLSYANPEFGTVEEIIKEQEALITSEPTPTAKAEKVKKVIAEVALPIAPDGYELLGALMTIKEGDYFLNKDAEGQDYWDEVTADRIGKKVKKSDASEGWFFIRPAVAVVVVDEQYPEEPATVSKVESIIAAAEEAIDNAKEVIMSNETSSMSNDVSKELTKDIITDRWQDQCEVPEGYMVVGVGMRLYPEDIYIGMDGTEWLPIPTERVATTVKPADDFFVLRVLEETSEIETSNPVAEPFKLEIPEGYRALKKGEKIAEQDCYWHVGPGDNESEGEWIYAENTGMLYTDGTYIRPVSAEVLKQEVKPVMQVASDQPDDLEW